MDRICNNCKWFTPGLTQEQQKAWQYDKGVNGVCHLYFPRGYIGRKPPHPAYSGRWCFQFEERSADEQMTMEEVFYDTD